MINIVISPLNAPVSLIDEHEKSMQISHTSKISDRFGRYYTDLEIARLLVESMAVSNPVVAIDLGAGDGALVAEANRQWDATRFITVDIDGAVVNSLSRQLLGSVFTHHIGDALDSSLAEKIGVSFGTVDSGLCNPPYIRPKWRQSFGEILEDAGLSNIIPKLRCIHADVLFIAQNLRFLKDGGKLGLILPDGLIAGERYAKLRKTLASAHRLERVIELPRRIFPKTDAKAHIVIIAKHGTPCGTTQIQRLEKNGLLSEAISLPPDQVETRLDYSYLAVLYRKDGRRRGIPLRNITQFVTRGIFSSAKRKELNFPVFHSTDFVEGNTEVPPHFLLKEIADYLTINVLAYPGDILLARVGRNLEQKICIVTHGVVAVTDCILILRVAPIWRQKALHFLTSSTGRTTIAAVSHGVGAKFITTEALLNLEI